MFLKLKFTLKIVLKWKTDSGSKSGTMMMGFNSCLKFSPSADILVSLKFSY